eukprot:scaffold293835_cov23-Tisochrysis_lutea.AAC.3
MSSIPRTSTKSASPGTAPVASACWVAASVPMMSALALVHAVMLDSCGRSASGVPWACSTAAVPLPFEQFSPPRVLARHTVGGGALRGAGSGPSCLSRVRACFCPSASTSA